MKRLQTRPVRFFVSYAHENAAWFGKLRPLLHFPTHTKVAHVWHDQELKAGDRWDPEIRRALDDMDVFVCLVSYEFLASGYIREVELPRALERTNRGEVEVVPILLYDVDLACQCEELHGFNPLPAWGKCWRDYEKDGGHYQDAHKPIREGLWQAIEKVQGRRKTRRV